MNSAKPTFSPLGFAHRVNILESQVSGLGKSPRGILFC